MKDEELVNIKKKLSVEIESLTVRLHEAESRLKNEVEKIKQKMTVTVHELEMSLQAANKSNVQLQDTCKVQQTKIHELTAAYDDTSRKMQSAVEQYQVTIKRLQIMEQELSTMKVSFGAATKDRAVMETKIKELTTRITEITNINNSVTMVKTKLENELKSVSADYDDIARELKLADERANKVEVDR